MAWLLWHFGRGVLVLWPHCVPVSPKAFLPEQGPASRQRVPRAEQHNGPAWPSCPCVSSCFPGDDDTLPDILHTFPRSLLHSRTGEGCAPGSVGGRWGGPEVGAQICSGEWRELPWFSELSLTPSECCLALRRGSTHGVLCADPGYVMRGLCPVPCLNGSLIWGMRSFGVCLCPAGDITSFFLPHFRVVPHTLSQHSSTRSSPVPLVFTLEPAPQSSELTVQTGGITLLPLLFHPQRFIPFVPLTLASLQPHKLMG